MKRILFTIFCLTVFASCNNENKLPSGIEVFSKTIAFNEISTEGLVLCEEEKENSEDNCVFYLNGKKYQKRVRYFFSKGIFTELYTYHSEGPLIYSLASLKSDSELQSEYQTKNQSIKLIPSIGIIDNGDTITDFTIDIKNKLILANKSNYKRTSLSERECVIYEYKK